MRSVAALVHMMARLSGRTWAPLWAVLSAYRKVVGLAIVKAIQSVLSKELLSVSHLEQQLDYSLGSWLELHLGPSMAQHSVPALALHSAKEWVNTSAPALVCELAQTWVAPSAPTRAAAMAPHLANW
jgi:hypothetical protein